MDETVAKHRQTNTQSHLVHPKRQASTLAGIYFAVSIVYIVLSDYLVALMGGGVYDFVSLQTIKGSLFVTVTALLLFITTYVMLTQMARRESELHVYRDALLASEHRAAAGLFAASFAHDINNILSITQGVLTQIGRVGQLPAPVTESLNTLNEANQKLQRLAHQIKVMATPEEATESRWFDLVVEINETLDLLRKHRRVQGCEIAVETPGSFYFRGKAGLVHQMLFNLVLNAADSVDNKGKILIRILPGEGHDVVIEVHDGGPGVAPQDRERILEPFVTTKSYGSGLGLLSVTACAAVHHGTLAILDSAELGGACFRMVLRSEADSSR